MKKPKIENKPRYCHAWTSKNSDTVQCNTFNCCGFFISQEYHDLKKQSGKSKFNYNGTGKHPIIETEPTSSCCDADILFIDINGHGKCSDCKENCTPL
jgi:hypothetical protein